MVPVCARSIKPNDSPKIKKNKTKQDPSQWAWLDMNLSMSLGTPQGLAMLNASNLLVVWNEFPSAEDPRCVNSTKMGILEQRWQQPSKHLFSPSFVSGLNERIPPIFYVASWEEEERGQKDPWQPSGERDSRRCWGGHGSPQRSTLWVYRASGES